MTLGIGLHGIPSMPHSCVLPVPVRITSPLTACVKTDVLPNWDRIGTTVKDFLKLSKTLSLNDSEVGLGSVFSNMQSTIELVCRRVLSALSRLHANLGALWSLEMLVLVLVKILRLLLRAGLGILFPDFISDEEVADILNCLTFPFLGCQSPWPYFATVVSVSLYVII